MHLEARQRRPQRVRHTLRAAKARQALRGGLPSLRDRDQYIGSAVRWRATNVRHRSVLHIARLAEAQAAVGSGCCSTA